MEIVNSLFFTLLGVILGSGFTLWKEWKDRRNDRSYIISYLKEKETSSKECLKSIEAEFHFFDNWIEQGSSFKFEKPSGGMLPVDNISIFRSVYTKSHSSFSKTEKALIENYINANELLTEYYYLINKYINSDRKIDALYKIEGLFIQWLYYIEIRYVFNKNVSAKKKDFEINFKSLKNGINCIALKYDVDYITIRKTTGKHYTRQLKFRNNNFNYGAYLKWNT